MLSKYIYVRISHLTLLQTSLGESNNLGFRFIGNYKKMASAYLGQLTKSLRRVIAYPFQSRVADANRQDNMGVQVYVSRSELF